MSYQKVFFGFSFFLLLTNSAFADNLNKITEAVVEIVQQRGIVDGEVLVASTYENIDGDFVTAINYFNYPNTTTRQEADVPQPSDFNNELGSTPAPFNGDVTFSGSNGPWNFSFRFRFVGTGNGGYGSGSSWSCIVCNTTYEENDVERQ